MCMLYLILVKWCLKAHDENANRGFVFVSHSRVCVCFQSVLFHSESVP